MGVLERPQGLDQLAEPRIHAVLVGDGLDGRALLSARVGTGHGHLRLFVPAEQSARPDEIVDYPEPTKKFVEAVVHAQLR